MKEKLIIKNFGPIKHVELELDRFNVLIGENATGKSTVAKVLAVCRYFSYIIQDDLFPNTFKEGLVARGLSEFIRTDSKFYYQCADYSFEANAYLLESIDENESEQGKTKLITTFAVTLTSRSEKFMNLLNELERLKKFVQNQNLFSLYELNWTIPTSFFQQDVSVVMNNPFYLPTERGLQSIFSLGKNSIQNLSDALFNQLAELDSIARLFKKETSIEPLGITYKNVNGHGYIKKKKDTDFYSLYNAASGYQSTIPIVLLAKHYSEVRKKFKTFIIEEPELNLFPSAQDKLMHYLVDKTINYGNSILLTTHSPYILTSINNLLYSYKVGDNNPEEINNIIDKKYWLNPDEVSAYKLMEDGTAKNILDKDLSMIDPAELDEVSSTINETWDKIADVEYSKTEKLDEF